MQKEIKAARLAAGGAALAAAILALIKLGLYLLSSSLVIGLSAWDSGTDVVISFINRMIIKYARLDADSNHPYGHGKAESITALGQGALITGGAIVILGSSCQNLYKLWMGEAEPAVEYWPTVLFFIGASFLSFLIMRWLRFFGERFHSPALLADSTHYRMDVVSNLASAFSIAAIILSENPWLDPIIAGVFSIYIALNGFKLLRTNINDLMDHEVPEKIKAQAIQLIADSDDHILDIHNFRSRKSGWSYFFDFHVTLSSSLNFPEVHHIISKIEYRLQKQFQADVVVRADPDNLNAQEPRIVCFSRKI